MTPSKTPKHLWAGDWQERADEPRPQRPPHDTAVHPTEPAAGDPGAARRRFPTRAALGGFGLGALVVAGAVALATSGGSDPKPVASSAKALPAVASPAVKGKANETHAAAIYAAASPAVVSIRTGSGSGTGFLIDGKGTIVTNAHVVDTSKEVEVHFGESGDAIQG